MSTIRRGVGWIRTHLKRYAWRAMAGYLWLVALGAIFGFYGALSRLQEFLLGSLLITLTSIGFEPVNPDYLGIVFGVLWVLTITVFRPRELVGLFFYVLFFPFIALLFLILFLIRLFYRGAPIQGQRPQASLATEQPVRFFAICVVLLGAWVALYGGATDLRQVLPGIILSGIVFILLLFRLFSRVRPTSESRLVRFDWFTRFVERSMVEPYSKDLDPNDYDISKLDN
jgi:hypothetical protein